MHLLQIPIKGLAVELPPQLAPLLDAILYPQLAPHVVAEADRLRRLVHPDVGDAPRIPSHRQRARPIRPRERLLAAEDGLVAPDPGEPRAGLENR